MDDKQKIEKNNKEYEGQPLSPVEEGREQRRREKLKKRIKQAAAIIGSTMMMSIAATEMMLFVMFGRNGAVSNEPFPLQNWARKNGLYWQGVEYPSQDNLLRGYLIAPQNPCALLVITHGMNASSDGFEPVVQYFARKGYAVLIFDGTASGRSTGMQVVGLQQQRYDVRATVQYIRQTGMFADIPLVLLGHSAGAYGSAVEAKDAGAAAVVCVSGFYAPLDTMKHWARNYTSVLADIEYPFLWARQHFSLGRETNTSAVKALCAAGLPALVAQGSEDEAVEDKISLYHHMLKQNAPNVTCILEENPQHNMHSNILFDNGRANDALLDRIHEFIQSHIR